MPNRVLRNYTNSEKVNTLSLGAECFFVRLITTVDDYGRYYAKEGQLLGAMYTLRPAVKTKDITGWLNECVKARLIDIYDIKEKRYLQIHDFRQRLDRAREKYPPNPQSIDNQNGNDFPRFDNDIPPESQSETESQSQNPKPNPESQSEKAGYVNFIETFNLITGKKFIGDKKSEAQWNARKKEGAVISDFELAISNCFQDDYHRENPKYLTPEFITRSDKLQKFLNWKPTNNGKSDSSPADILRRFSN